MARAMFVGVVSVLMLCGLSAQAEVVKTYELAGSYSSLSETVSTTDLIQGFPEDTDEDGSPVDQGLNESAVAPYGAGVVELINWEPTLVSWLMNPWDDCLPMNEYQASDGFHPATNPAQRMPVFTDGTFNTDALAGLLRDYGRAALVVRYGFESPVDIGTLRVFGGNMNNNDGRVFQHYDVYARQGDCADGICPAHGTLNTGLIGHDEFFLVAEEVKSGEFGVCNCDDQGNEGPWQVSMTNVAMEYDDKPLIKNCTDLRIVFYCVGNTGKRFQDEMQGNENEEEDYQLECSYEEEGDTDGLRKAFEGGIIKEIDVLPPVPTRWGDIDADGDRDLVDFAAMQGCYGEDVNSNGCYRFDFNEDEAVDAADVEGFVDILSGPTAD